MSRDWKPGDVAALVLKQRADGRTDTDREAVGIRDNVGSWASGAAIGRTAYDKDVVEARPLLLIDPEDPRQIERLCGAMLTVDNHDGRPCYSTTCHVARLGEAIRLLIASPKPEEPTGLGAVVEDDGNTWTRVITTFISDYPWIDGTCEWRRWDDFTPTVKVLSEGVTP